MFYQEAEQDRCEREWSCRSTGTFRLSDLLKRLETDAVFGDIAVPITGIAFHHLAVRPGNVFFCVRGYKHDGHDFIPEAAGRGAAALLVEGPGGLEAARAALGLKEGSVSLKPGTAPTVVVVPATRLSMGLAAAAFYGHPSRRLRVIGVTGTNGKTTTTHMIRELLLKNGVRCGLIGTVHTVVGGKSLPAGRTTPEAFDLQNLAGEMLKAGDTHLAMEVASHALTLERVAGFEFDIAVFTNLTQDHLDFHGDLENYYQAKARLFGSLGTSYQDRPKPGLKAAVLNADDPSSPRLATLVGVPVVTFGLDSPAAGLSASEVSFTPSGAMFTLKALQGLGAGLKGFPAFEARVILPLIGRYNVSNALSAVAVCLLEGVPPPAAVSGLASLRGAPGRFETVDAGQDFTAVVDYAHSPDSLRNVLEAARALIPGRVITVFGCGGDRDRSKRPLMGEVAARHSDLCVLTSDNPRSEDPGAVIEDIRPGLERLGRKAGSDYVVCLDRTRAIELAVGLAGAGDLVLVAGKGHETGQTFADRTIPFDDREVLREVLSRRGAGGGDAGDG